MVITSPFYSPCVFDEEVVISTTSNKQRVVVSSPKRCPDGNCLRIILLIVWLATLNGGYVSVGSEKLD